MSKKKILTIAISVALVAILVVGASLAYFTDTTQKENNVFTLGNVDIDLTETFDPENAKLMPGSTIEKIPVVTVEDDSENCWLFVEIEFSRYVPVVAYMNSLPEYRALANDPIAQSVMLTDTFLDNFVNADWVVMNGDSIPTAPNPENGEWPAYATLILGYQKDRGNEKAGVLKAGQDVTIFEGVKFPADLENQKGSNGEYFYYTNGQPITGGNTLELNITAKAIQAENVDTLQAAYAALYPSNP